MSSTDEAIALLITARERLEQSFGAVETIRQTGAEAAGYVHQAVGSHDSIGSRLARMTDAASQVGELSGAAIEAINAEIAYLQARR